MEERVQSGLSLSPYFSSVLRSVWPACGIQQPGSVFQTTFLRVLPSPLLSTYAATELMPLSHPLHVPERLSVSSGDHWPMEGAPPSSFGADYCIAPPCRYLWKATSFNLERALWCCPYSPYHSFCKLRISDLVSIRYLRVTKQISRRGGSECFAECAIFMKLSLIDNRGHFVQLRGYWGNRALCQQNDQNQQVAG